MTFLHGLSSTLYLFEYGRKVTPNLKFKHQVLKTFEFSGNQRNLRLKQSSGLICSPLHWRRAKGQLCSSDTDFHCRNCYAQIPLQQATCPLLFPWHRFSVKFHHTQKHIYTYTTSHLWMWAQGIPTRLSEATESLLALKAWLFSNANTLEIAVHMGATTFPSRNDYIDDCIYWYLKDIICEYRWNILNKTQPVNKCIKY